MAISIEGYSPDEILALPQEEVEAYVFSGKSVILNAGSARILGEFRIAGNNMVIELAEINGGGEGVLPTLWLLAERYARSRSLKGVEWVVHAINCANPNLKLRRILTLRGFQVRDVDGVGEAYYFYQPV
jgi:hypothetical protein